MKKMSIFLFFRYSLVSLASAREKFSVFKLSYFCSVQTILNDAEKTISLQISLLQVVGNVIGRSLILYEKVSNLIK